MTCPECGSKWVQIMIEADLDAVCLPKGDYPNMGHFALCTDCDWESETVSFAEAVAQLEEK